MEKRSVTGYCAGADGGNEKFHELDIPHSGFYAEGAGATFLENIKRNYTKLYRLENVMDSRCFPGSSLI